MVKGVYPPYTFSGPTTRKKTLFYVGLPLHLLPAVITRNVRDCRSVDEKKYFLFASEDIPPPPSILIPKNTNLL